MELYGKILLFFYLQTHPDLQQALTFHHRSKPRIELVTAPAADVYVADINSRHLTYYFPKYELAISVVANVV